MALAAAAIAAVTLIVAPLVMGLVSNLGTNVRVWSVLLSEAGLALVAVSALLGFVAGAERTADFFALIWGTHELWQNERFVRVVLTIVIVCMAIAITISVL